MVQLQKVQLIIGVLVHRLAHGYLHMRDAKELQDALESQFDTADVSGELYVTEQINDYGMVEKCSMVEKAH